MSAALEAILEFLEADFRVGALERDLIRKEVAVLRGELDELKARMPADNPCDEEHMREIST